VEVRSLLAMLLVYAIALVNAIKLNSATGPMVCCQECIAFDMGVKTCRCRCSVSAVVTTQPLPLIFPWPATSRSIFLYNTRTFNSTSRSFKVASCAYVAVEILLPSPKQNNIRIIQIDYKPIITTFLKNSKQYPL
jgi:hypothetical protein